LIEARRRWNPEDDPSVWRVWVRQDGISEPTDFGQCLSVLGVGTFSGLRKQRVGMLTRLRVLIVGAFPPRLYLGFQSAQTQIYRSHQAQNRNQCDRYRGKSGN
jgi:hypothetical protein